MNSGLEVLIRALEAWLEARGEAAAHCEAIYHTNSY